MKSSQRCMVLFHSKNEMLHCDDGWASAVVAHDALKAQGFQPTLVPCIYGKRPPFVPGKGLVYMVDFSFPKDVMLGLLRDIGPEGQMIVIDHHKNAAEALQALQAELQAKPDPELAPLKVTFDNDHSGAVLTWKHFHPGEEVPFILRVVEAGDLWQFDRVEDSPIYQAALRTYPQTLEVWQGFLAMREGDDASKAFLQEGRTMRRFIELKVKELAAGAWVMEIGGEPMLVANAPPIFASELAGFLAEQGEECGLSGMGAVYHDEDRARVFSLRSRKGGGDVSAIARKYGGNGHAGAAGFQMPL